MDCEGAEFSLLDPERDSILLSTNILVEVHEEAGRVEVLLNRFEATHNVKIATPIKRRPSDAPTNMPEMDVLLAMDERPQTWLYLTVKTALAA